MKLDQQELEILCLSALVKYPKCMDKLITRGIGEDHFEYQAQNEKTCFTRALYMLIHKYWQESGGSLFTSYVLESKFQEYGFVTRKEFAEYVKVVSELQAKLNEIQNKLSQ